MIRPNYRSRISTKAHRPNKKPTAPKATPFWIDPLSTLVRKLRFSLTALTLDHGDAFPFPAGAGSVLRLPSLRPGRFVRLPPDGHLRAVSTGLRTVQVLGGSDRVLHSFGEVDPGEGQERCREDILRIYEDEGQPRRRGRAPPLLELGRDRSRPRRARRGLVKLFVFGFFCSYDSLDVEVALA